MIVTIDGPTASGKSTIGRTLAQRLNSYYIYSGLLYRAVAYHLVNTYGYTEKTIDNPDHEHVKNTIKHMRYEYSPADGERIFFNNKDITSKLKQRDIDQLASILSTNAFVRKQINTWQHVIANEHDVIIDGRDAGTIVFPHAQFKFFLTARPQIRAERWRAQQIKRGNDIAFDDALDFISLRDNRDSNREHAPLRVAQNGITIDNSDLDVQETIDVLMNHIGK